MFNCESITAFMRNKNIKESIGSNEIEKNKAKKKDKYRNKNQANDLHARQT